MGHNTEVPSTSGIQVLDRAIFILSVIAAEPRNLAELCEITGLPRATTHRIAVALEKHRLIERLPDSQWTAGPALTELAPQSNSRLEEAAEYVLPKLMQETNESVQLYRLSGMERVCIANAEPAAGLRDTVPVGTRMTLEAGSAAKVLVGHSSPSLQKEVLATAAYSADELRNVVQEGVADSHAERDPSLASASVPVFDTNGSLIAALSISGPADRIGKNAGARYGAQLKAAALELQKQLK
ncbi:IclR family transcriptional regulator [Corynebacterium anserum]|uniref:Helix-turn-helix domain-containing protein n=1 Tax=Corynebacterium anserum TaxID=2684406 RepID=A0A7G7YNZ3_9CORY|nr:IclR family transcriptional regulator [Corynebacterium anserum]MBC2681814.1 helix-turn-helix domain-containing protein [Corynebacterium anserum]QNH96213.1 helix-turn-helix domain-containing protein [Corynebacterium anserum]